MLSESLVEWNSRVGLTVARAWKLSQLQWLTNGWAIAPNEMTMPQMKSETLSKAPRNNLVPACSSLIYIPRTGLIFLLSLWPWYARSAALCIALHLCTDVGSWIAQGVFQKYDPVWEHASVHWFLVAAKMLPYYEAEIFLNIMLCPKPKHPDFCGPRHVFLSSTKPCFGDV